MTATRTLLALALAAGMSRADIAVPLEGPVIRGPCRVDAERGQLRVGEETRPLSQFLLVEKDDGTLLWAPDTAARVRGYRKMVFEGRRVRLVELAKEAVRARDAATARRIYEQAVREGLDGKDERIVRVRVENLEKRSAKINRDRIAPVLEELARVRDEVPDRLFRRASGELDPGGAGRAILREILREFPDHKAALEAVRGLVPEGFPFPEPEAWLDFHLGLETLGFTLCPEDDLELKKARHYWRPDLYGLRSRRVLLLTASRDLPLATDCALRAHLAIGVLEELFKTDNPRKRTDAPLPVHLFVDVKNFRERVGYARVADVPPYFRWELGQWDFDEDICRILVPAGAKPGHRELGTTLVHEVVRQWLWTRCLRYSSSELMYKEPTAGYGIAVGLPLWLAECGLTEDRRALDLGRKGTPSLRLVAAGGTKSYRLFDWSDWFLTGRDEIHRMNAEDPNLYKRPRAEAPWGHLFMMQGAAAVHWLYNADGGRRRQALADYVTYQYLGDQPKMNPRTAFGMDPKEMGTAVRAWSTAD